MHRIKFKSKIHRATATRADPRTFSLAEKVQIVDITNGARLDTYTIEAPADSGVIGINGAAAHLSKPRDLVILISYCAARYVPEVQTALGKRQARTERGDAFVPGYRLPPF